MALPKNIEALSSANNEFSLSLYKEIVKTETGNIFYSPFGIHLIMFMASTGAASKTFDEMVATLNLDATTHSLEAYRELLENITSENHNLKLATGMFVDTAFNVKDSFVENSMEYLKSSMKRLNFKDNAKQQRQYLNKWVSSKTNNQVKDLFSRDSIDELTALVLVNVVHFKSDWEHKFKYDGDDFFYVTPSNKVTVKMMTHTYFFRYYHDSVLKFKALELPYKKHAFKMTILLPDDKDGLNDLENNFSKFKLHDISKKMKQRFVNVELPRFRIEQSLQLDETLSNLGCPTMFTPDANFSNIVKDGDVDQLYVNKIFHKTFIDVNEEGTEATAATSCRHGLGSARFDEDFIVNHPFIFFISTRCNSIIFVGRNINFD